jgi:hypothetical protein
MIDYIDVVGRIARTIPFQHTALQSHSIYICLLALVWIQHNTTTLWLTCSFQAEPVTIVIHFRLEVILPRWTRRQPFRCRAYISKPQTKPSALLGQPHTPIPRSWLQFNNVSCSHKIRFMVIILTGHVAASIPKSGRIFCHKIYKRVFCVFTFRIYSSCNVSSGLVKTKNML